VNAEFAMPWFLVACAAHAAPTLQDLARDAFVWGYPLVVSSRTMATPGTVNELTWSDGLADETSHDIVMPNNDTLYVTAILDLRSEPMVLDLVAPDDDRYFSFQFLDAWMESFAYVGTRATDGRSGTWVITPPGWEGTLPDGVEELRSATPQLVLLGRYGVLDDADAQRVIAARDDVHLLPLSEFTHTRPPAPDPEPLEYRGAPSAAGLKPFEFWDELGDCLAINPPRTRADSEFLARLAPLGVGRGLHPSETAEGALFQALYLGAQEGLDRVHHGGAGVDRNGWNVPLDLGVYGHDDDLRAFVAWSAWGANVAAEAVYPATTTDFAGRRLDGWRSTYRIVFPAGELPPSDAFWSLTVYDNDGFLVGNRLDRFSVGSRTRRLRYGRDGSLNLVLSPDAPTDTPNWLPIPRGPFKLTMRVYLPQPSVLDGTWAPPPIQRTSSKD
jgi:hypothetical protein